MSSTFEKRYSSPAEIIEILEERGLMFSDKREAECRLRHIGYYRFSAYLYPFISLPKSEQRFKTGSMFDVALSLYDFDQKLRALIFRHIADVEVAIRSAMANIVAKETGNIFWMTDASLFADVEHHRRTSLIIDKELLNSREEFIEHFRGKYSDPYPPAWILVEILPMGVLNHIYGNLRSNVLRKRIASHFSLSAPVFSSWLTVIVLMRNACCHHARVWNKRNAIVPVVPHRMARAWMSSGVVPDRVFYDLSIIKFFIDQVRPKNRLKEELKCLLGEYGNVDMRAMGFPEGWEEEELWR